MKQLDDMTAVPDLLLERYILDELPHAEMLALERRLAEDVSLQRRLAALEDSNHQIRRAYPPAWIAGRIRARMAEAGLDLEAGSVPASHARGRFLRWAIPAGLATAVLAVFVLMLETTAPFREALFHGRPAAEGEDTRIKGLEPALAIYRRSANGSEELADGDVAREGDLVRIGYRASGRPYGIILSIDGRGHVTVHLPVVGQTSVALQPGAVVLLDHAYELDEAPHWERFFFVTGTEPFEVAPIVDAARRVEAAAKSPLLPLPPGLEQSVFSLSKEVP
jgi:hypothetical protein